MPVTLLGASEIRALAAELDVTPTKKLGQNFVVDANSVRRIVQVARVQPGERVVEIGPGLGSLTLAVLETGASVTAVEIDHRLAAPPCRDRGRARRRRRCARGRRCRCAACDGAARRTHGAGCEPSLQRLGPGAAALPRDLPVPAARRRHGAGRGRRTTRSPAGLEDLRRAECEGGLVRTVAPRGHRLEAGVLAGAQRRQRAGRVHPRRRSCAGRRRSGSAPSRSWMPHSSSVARCCGRPFRGCSAAPRRRHPRFSSAPGSLRPHVAKSSASMTSSGSPGRHRATSAIVRAPVPRCSRNMPVTFP